MALASSQASKVRRPRTLWHMLCFLFLIIAGATVNTPALGDHSSPPSYLVIYDHQVLFPSTDTGVIVASPSGNLSQFQSFGTTAVVANVLREGEAADSPVLGTNDGLLVVERDNSYYVATTYVLQTGSFTGTISTQGVVTQPGDGELAITGGTGDFRWARGYLDIDTLSQDPQDIVYRAVFHIKYD